MALSEKSRAELYRSLTSIASEEATSEMLSYFPARDLDEPVTKEFLRAELADLRLDMYAQITGVQSQINNHRQETHAQISGVQADISNLRDDMHTQIGNLRDDMHTEITGVQSQIGNLRDDMHTEITGVQADISNLRDDMRVAMQRMIIWTISTMITLAGLIAGIAFAVR